MLLLWWQRPSSRHEELKERARHLLEQARREAQSQQTGPQRSLSKVCVCVCVCLQVEIIETEEEEEEEEDRIHKALSFII